MPDDMTAHHSAQQIAMISAGPCQSAEIDKIVAALAGAVAEIEQPERNQTATVNTKKGYTYEYRYADLSTVMAAIRGPLAKANVIIVHQVEERRLTVRALHASGQWIGSWATLKPAEDGPQAFASALTAYRRHLTLGLLGLAPVGDDDDANLAEGNRVTPGKRTRDRWESASKGGDPLLEEIERVDSVRAAVVLLENWRFHRQRMEQLRRAGAPEFTAVVNAAGKAIQDHLGNVIAAVWKGWMMATTKEHHIALQAKLDGEWAATMAAFREAEPAGFHALTRHINDRYVQIQDDAVKAAEKAEKEGGRKSPPAPPPFSHALVDANGEVGEAYTSPADFARALEALVRSSPVDQWDALMEHNADATAEASSDIGADIILRDLVEFVATHRADMTMNPDHEMAGQEPQEEDLIVSIGDDPSSYLPAVRSALDGIGDAATLKAWIAANQPIYSDRKVVPPNIQVRVMYAVASCCRDLGIDPKAI